jgi:hypothetical protein
MGDTMTKWEHAFCTVDAQGKWSVPVFVPTPENYADRRPHPAPSNISMLLEQMGGEGWELVTVHDISSSTWFYFKRPTKEF